VAGADVGAGARADAGVISAGINIEEYLERHERKGLLRFITCGSVDERASPR